MSLTTSEQSYIATSNNRKHWNELSESDKANMYDSEIPKKILDHITDYPTEEDESDWRIIDYDEKSDGSAVLTTVKIDGKEKTIERSIGKILMPSDEELFKIEKQQLEKGILTHVAERTLDKHISEGTLDSKNLNDFKISRRLKVDTSSLKTIAKKVNGKVKRR